MPFLPVSKAGPSGAPVGVDKTPTPPDTVVVVTPPPEDKLSGKLVYAKAGNIWVQDATSAHQITNFGRDAMPSFSPDGKWIIYIETLIDHKKYALHNRPPTWYTLTYPILYRIHPDGTGRQRLTDGLFTSAQGTWTRRRIMRGCAEHEVYWLFFSKNHPPVVLGEEYGRRFRVRGRA